MLIRVLANHSMPLCPGQWLGQTAITSQDNVFTEEAGTSSTGALFCDWSGDSLALDMYSFIYLNSIYSLNYVAISVPGLVNLTVMSLCPHES